MTKKFLFLITAFIFSTHVCLSSQFEDVGVHTRTPQDFAVMAQKLAKQAHALKTRYAGYDADQQSRNVVTACENVETAMCKLYGVDSVTDISDELSEQSLRVFRDADVHTVLDLTDRHLTTMDEASEEVLKNMKMWPGWQLRRAKEAWMKDSSWPRLMGTWGQLLAGAGYLIRLPFPGSTRDCLAGVASAGAAYAVKASVSSKQPVQSIHVHVGSSSDTSFDVSSKLNRDRAAAAAALVGLAGVGIGATKVGWAWWHGAAGRASLDEAVVKLSTNQLLSSTVIRLIDAQYGIDRLQVGQGEIREGLGSVRTAIGTRLSTAEFNARVAKLVTQEGLTAALEAANEGRASAAELQAVKDTIETLATAQSVRDLAAAVLTREEFTRCAAGFATATSLNELKRSIPVTIAEKLQAAEDARQVINERITREQREAMRVMFEREQALRRQEIATVTQAVNEAAESMGVRLEGFEQLFLKKMREGALEWRTALAEIADENRHLFKAGEAQRFAILVQGTMQQKMITAGLARMGCTPTAAELADTTVYVDGSVVGAFGHSATGSPSRGLPMRRVAKPTLQSLCPGLCPGIFPGTGGGMAMMPYALMRAAMNPALGGSSSAALTWHASHVVVQEEGDKK